MGADSRLATQGASLAEENAALRDELHRMQLMLMQVCSPPHSAHKPPCIFTE